MKNRKGIILHIFLLLLVTVGPALFAGAVNKTSAFIASPDINIDGDFSDWGTLALPASGVSFYRDDGTYDAPDIKKELDLNIFWDAVSAQNGGTEPVSPSNPIENIYYRIDTYSKNGISGQRYFIKLNLGSAPLNYADHCLEIWADNSENPEVTIVLHQYVASAYPELKASTSADMIAVISNVSGYDCDVDTDAVGAIGQDDAGYYSVEVSIPVSWYGPDYGGRIEADGTGEQYIMGLLFSSSGTIGSVSTPKDILNNSKGYPIYHTIDTVSGDTVFLPKVTLGFIIGEQPVTAGQVSPVMAVQTQDRDGDAIDVTFTIHIGLTTSSSGGTFYSDPAGTNPIEYVTISAGTNLASFYYKDIVAGTPEITGAESPDRGWDDASQEVTITHAALDHFAFDTISDQVKDIAFDITITALDSYGNGVTSYTGNNILSDAEETIIPMYTGAFAGGVWTGEVTITVAYTGITITTSGGGRHGTSNVFDVTADIVVDDIYKMIFTTGKHTIIAGEVSSIMTIQTQDFDSNPIDVISDTRIDLTTSSDGGTFYSDADGTARITYLTINAGTSSASFYYKDTLSGAPVITAVEYPDQGWADAIQDVTVIGDIKIDPGKIIQISFEIINNTYGASTVAFQYQMPGELIFKSASVEPYGSIGSIVGNNISAVSGTLEPGNAICVCLTVETSRDVVSGDSLAQLLEPDYLLFTIEPVEDIKDSLSISDLTIERSKEKYYSFIPFAERIGEQTEVSVEVARLESESGYYQINIKARILDTDSDAVLLHTITDTSDGDAVKTDKYEIELIINNEVWDVQQVELASGESRRVVFNLDNVDTGEYTVNISGLEADFSSSLSVNWWLIFTTLLTVVFAGYLVKIYLFK